MEYFGQRIVQKSLYIILFICNKSSNLFSLVEDLQTMENRDFSEFEKYVLLAKNIQMCILLCLNDLTCLGFNYGSKNGLCYIKSKLGNVLARNNVVAANRTMGNALKTVKYAYLKYTLKTKMHFETTQYLHQIYT